MGAMQGGRAVGRYELVEELARGGMGIVYRGRDPAIGREVAVKLFACDERVRPGALERFQREARAAGKLRHPGVVAIHDFGIVGSTAYLVMDLIEGETLADRLRRGGPLEPREAARVCEALARTLAFAHEQGVVHRDIKPANVLLCGGQPLLVDFGIAKSQGATKLSTTGQLLGTPSYMAPEQLVGESGAVGPPADVYGLGGALYELLTGELPYDADNLLALITAKERGAPPTPAALRPEVGDDLSAICLRCLAHDPEDRYARAELLARDLAAYLAGEEVLANPLGRAERLRRGLRRSPVAVATGAAALTLTLLFAVTQLGPPDAPTTAADPAAVTTAPLAPVVMTPPVAAPPDLELVLEEARALAAGDKLGRAIKRYEVALGLLPRDDVRRPDVARALGEVHLARSRAARGARNFGAALADLEHALVHVPRSTEVWLDVATLHQATGDLSNMRAALDRLLDVDPRHATGLYLRGHLRGETSDIGGAIEDFTRCLELDPDHPEALHGRAWVRVLLGQGGQVGQLRGALQDYTRCLELDPTEGLTFQGRGYVHELLGDRPSAAADYERALELLPVDSPHRARSQSMLERARAARPR